MFIQSLCLFFVFSALSSRVLAQNVSQGRDPGQPGSNGSETKLNSHPPGWLLGLDLDATPGQIFEKSYANARVILEQRQEKERSDTPTPPAPKAPAPTQAPVRMEPSIDPISSPAVATGYGGKPAPIQPPHPEIT